MANYRYTLHLSQMISGGNAVTLDLSQFKAETIKLNEAEYDVTFTGLRFLRKIYQPGAVETELQFSPLNDAAMSSPDDVINALMYRVVRLTIAEVESQNDTSEIAPDGELTIAENYFVYQVRPQYEMQASGESMLFVKLTIYSIDKLMAMSKYSKVFLSQKLGEILQCESQQFKFGESSLIHANTEGLQKLVYDFKGQKTEFIQPYLVQYNESFYDFMVRVANRCGEFFFFEDGRCYLGLPDKPVKTVSRFSKITYQQQTTSPFMVSDYGRDSVKEGEGIIPGNRINCDPLGERDKKYPFPKDAFPDALAYHAEVAPDEFFMPLYKGKFTTMAHEEFGDGVTAGHYAANTGKHYFPILENVLRYDGDAASLIGAIAAEEAPILVSASIAANSGDNDDKYINSVKEGAYGAEKCDGEKALQFAGVDPKSWATMRYHADVKKYEQEQQQKIVCVDLGTNWENIRLGDRVRLGSGKQVYIVIQIKLMADEKWGHDYSSYDEVDITAPQTAAKSRQSMVFYAIPTVDEDGKNAFPPIHAGGAFRKSGSQNAFVVDNDDPKKQGRVRIIFPWQAKNIRLQTSYEEAKVALEKVRHDKASYESEISNIDQELAQQNILFSFLQSGKDNMALSKEKVMQLLKEKNDELAKAQQKETDYIDELKAKKDKKAALEKSDKATMEDVSKLAVEIMQMEKKHKVSAEKVTTMLNQKQELEKLLAAADSLTGINGYVEKKKKELEEQKKELIEKKNALKEKQEKAEGMEKKADQELSKQAEVLKEDRLSMSTPWIRVTTPLATEGGGTMFKLMEGDEVMVDFENGNVERPYVVGSVYSKDTVAPIYDFDRAATPDTAQLPSIIMESPTGHAITFQDGSNVIDFMSSFIPGFNVYFPTVASYIADDGGFDWGKTLSGGIRIADKYGMYTLDLSSSKRNVTIRSGMGDVVVDAFTGITIKAPNGNISIEGKNVDIKAYNRLSMTSGLNIKDKELLDDDEGAGLKVGNAIKDKLLTAFPSTVLSVCGAEMADFTFVRTMLEVFLKPVDGTMYIKSKRYMLLEAGSGEVQVDKDRYTQKKQDEITLHQDVYDKVKTGIEAISSSIDNHYQDMARLIRLAAKEEKWQNVVHRYCTEDLDMVALAFHNRLKPLEEAELDSKLKNDVNDMKKRRVLRDANMYLREAMESLDKFTQKNNKLSLEELEMLFADTTYIDGLKVAMEDFYRSLSDDIGSKCNTGNKLMARFYGMSDDELNTQKQKHKRIAVAKFLDQIKKEKDVKKVFNFAVRSDYMSFVDKNYAWTKFISTLDVQTNSGMVKGWIYEVLAKPLVDMYHKETAGWKRLLARDNVWNEAKGGQILFSDDSNHTYHLGEDTARDNKPTLKAQSGTNYKKDLWGDLKEIMIGLK